MELRQIGRFNFLAWAACLLMTLAALPAMSQQVEDASPSVDDSAKVDDAGVDAPAKRRSSSELLPTSTRFWISIEDLRRLETNVANTQLGKLARQDTLAPFFASFEKQLKGALNDNGIKFGLDVASVEALETGEVAIAGVLPNAVEGMKVAPRSHGVVVLIDVSPGLLAAEDFLEDAAAKMAKRGAKQEEVEILGTKVSKWTVEVESAKISRTQSSFVTIVDGWILASDNESIFSNVLRQINSKKKPGKGAVLASYEPFMTVEAKTHVDGVRPDFRWFLDPIGYARFADALAEEKADLRQPKDRPLESLSKEGLDALKAAGGFVSFSTGEHDVLHRSLVYAKPKEAKDAKEQRLFNLLDFAPAGVSVAKPPQWIPGNVAAYFDATWDIKKAFANVGPFVDSIAGKDIFEDVLESMKTNPDFNVDLKKVVGSVGNRITVMAATEEPISEQSEKMAIGIPLEPGVDEDWLIESIGRAVKGKVKVLGGFKIVEDDRVPKEDDGELGGGIIDLDEFDDFDDDESEEDEIDELPPRVTLFNRRIFVIRNGVLLISNDKDYLKKVISRPPSDEFGDSADLAQLTTTLSRISEANNVRFRMFSRLDQMFKLNYEMMRTGRMAESETFLARILNQIYGGQTNSDQLRTQQIDGSELPSDYEKEIAPFLGIAGWVLETTDSGWRISGCVLPKEKAKAKVAEAPESAPKVDEAPESKK